MTSEDSSRNRKTDWLARVLGLLGLVLSVASILWQIHVYREGHTERVIARVTIHHVHKPHEDVEEITREGGVSVEVVNIGQQVLYLRKVSIEPCYPRVGRLGIFYESGSDAGTDVSRLEPSAYKTFSIKKWDFDAMPLEPQDDESLDTDTGYCVVVQSTRGEILRSPSPIKRSSIDFIGTIKHK